MSSGELVGEKVEECEQIIGLGRKLDRRLIAICREIQNRILEFEKRQKNGTVGWVKLISRTDYIIAIIINIIVLLWYVLSIIT